MPTPQLKAVTDGAAPAGVPSAPSTDGALAGRIPLVAAITSALGAAAAVALRHDTAALALGVLLIAFLIPIAAIDIERRLIPNRLTGPAAILAIVVGTVLDPHGEITRLIAGAAAGGALALPSLLHPKGIGMGDAKLVGVMGLFLGAAVVPAFFIAVIVGTALGMVIMARSGIAAGRKTKIPFGPFLALGGVVAVFAGHPLLDVYLHIF